ncbi:hypothetical protein B566_EDAN013095 [Ephemera danica]|nr:hypothetical protein B566_EDAN013095 [Ephemera danica]
MNKMKSPILFTFCTLCILGVVPAEDSFITHERVLIGINNAVNITKGFLNQNLNCYDCINNEENGACAQGNAAKQCEMRSLLLRFGSLLKAKFLGKPTVVPVCLRAEIQVGEKLVTRHSCAMVNQRDSLDEATCKSSLYMLGGVSGEVEKCEMCATDRCNAHKRPTSRAQQAWEPYVEASALVQSMELGHVQHNMQIMRYTGTASPLTYKEEKQI